MSLQPPTVGSSTPSLPYLHLSQTTARRRAGDVPARPASSVDAPRSLPILGDPVATLKTEDWAARSHQLLEENLGLKRLLAQAVAAASPVGEDSREIGRLRQQLTRARLENAELKKRLGLPPTVAPFSPIAPLGTTSVPAEIADFKKERAEERKKFQRQVAAFIQSFQGLTNALLDATNNIKPTVPSTKADLDITRLEERLAAELTRINTLGGEVMAKIASAREAAEKAQADSPRQAHQAARS